MSQVLSIRKRRHSHIGRPSVWIFLQYGRSDAFGFIRSDGLPPDNHRALLLGFPGDLVEVDEVLRGVRLRSSGGFCGNGVVLALVRVDTARGLAMVAPWGFRR